MIFIIGVRFRKSGKVYYFDPNGMQIEKGNHVIVETSRGIEYGTVVLPLKEITDDQTIQPLKPVIRIATPNDDTINNENEQKEKEAFTVCQEKIKQHNLNMKLIDSKYTFDRNKLLFYFTADGRIDFRELVKDLASVFRTRIELRQIGVRDETKMIGGIAICGRPLCCHSYLSDFAPVSIKMAKEQNLSLNPAKISGVCGRLMCCLKNEQEAYEHLNSTLPHIGTTVETSDNFKGEVQSVSVLKQRVKVLIENDNGEKEVRDYPVSELSFTIKNNSKNTSVAPALPDEELDENALKELEKLEKEDLDEATESNNQQYSNNKKQSYKNKGRNNYRNSPKNSAENANKDNTKNDFKKAEDESRKNYKKRFVNRQKSESKQQNTFENQNKKKYQNRSNNPNQEINKINHSKMKANRNSNKNSNNQNNNDIQGS